jgi:hypothetical protein
MELDIFSIMDTNEEIMLNKYGNSQDHAEYLKGTSWKCKSSPSGAHHWIIGNETICKYCHEIKQPQITQPYGYNVQYRVGKANRT